MHELTQKEYEFVSKFLQTREEDSYMYYGIWLDGFRSLFDPKNHQPMQVLKFYVLLNNRELEMLNYVTDTHTTSFSDYRNRIIREAKNYGTLIGPHIPDDSQFKDMVKIIKIFQGKFDPVFQSSNQVSSLI